MRKDTIKATRKPLVGEGYYQIQTVTINGIDRKRKLFTDGRIEYIN